MDKTISSSYSDKLKSMLQLQNEIKHIHPLLREHYPVVIVEDGMLNIFEYNDDSKYVLTQTQTDPMNMPKGIRAAFPLEFLDNKAAVFVSGEVFDSVAEQVIIFHEFAHCYQFHTCEVQLREQIELAKKSVNTENYFWELNYPFPYKNEIYIDSTRKLFNCLDLMDRQGIGMLRKQLKESLSSEQIEYMVWQEWKEGFARYIENSIKKYLKINQNHGGRKEPFARNTFYEMGSRLIGFIIKLHCDHHLSIQELYYALNDDRYFI